MQTQILQFFKDTAKVSSLPLLKMTTKATHFLPSEKKIQILWIKLQTNKLQNLKSQNLTFKHLSVKKLQTAKTFSKNVS